MKMLLLVAVAALSLLAITTDLRAADEAAAAPAKAAKSGKSGRGKLAHVVSFKFKDTATADDIRKVEKAFAALPSKIPQIMTYESGTNVSPEKLDKGFTHVFILTFKSAKDRDDYLVHPEHKAFGALLGPYLADAFVMDFWAQKAKGEGKAKKEKKDK